MTTPAPNAPTPPDGAPVHHLEAQRRANRDAVASLGLAPYGERTEGLLDLAAARARYNETADQAFQSGTRDNPGPDLRPVVRVAGRVVLHRDNGKLIWLNLRDHSGDLQVAASQRDCDSAGFDVAKRTDLGDVVVAEGPLMRTRTGEITVWARSLRPAAKCLMPPPEKHAGLADIETRYRRRYVDLWATPESMQVFQLRSGIVSRIRRFLDARGFMEVETPMLQVLAGGAAARPFRTHMNALGLDLFLRIAPELYLKRLLVGGMPRVYEVNRNFRNEGLDKQHNPEFTMLEVYEAFGDARTMMALVEDLIRDAASFVAGELARRATPADGLALPFGDLRIDYARPFERVAYAELFERALGFSMRDTDRVAREAAARGLPHAGLAPVLIANELFEEVAEPTLDPARPTFITDYPAAISPLTRPRPDNPEIADRADLFIGHMELAPMYTELNDPDVQAAKFREQLAGLDDEEATFRTFDQDFIDALKVGMPPAGGLGVGIDRLTMLLTGQRTIRDVVLFPLMRPAHSGDGHGAGTG